MDVKLFEKVLFEINHCFKLLFTLFKCVNSHKLSESQKKIFYSNIFTNVSLLSDLTNGGYIDEASEDVKKRK